MTHEYRSPKYWKEMNKLRAQARKLTSYKLPGPSPISNANKGLIHRKKVTSPQATGRKPPGPEPGAQASSPSPQAPRSGNQGTSGSVQASGHKQQG